MSDVPRAIRQEVLARDEQICRICGRWTEFPALHHIVFRSHGGLHVPCNLITVGYLPGHDCHLTIAHGPDSMMWREVFQVIVEKPGITAFQVRRWTQAG